MKHITVLAWATVPALAANGETVGHGTTGRAKFWKQELEALLRTAPRTK